MYEYAGSLMTTKKDTVHINCKDKPKQLTKGTLKMLLFRQYLSSYAQFCEDNTGWQKWSRSIISWLLSSSSILTVFTVLYNMMTVTIFPKNHCLLCV